MYYARLHGVQSCVMWFLNRGVRLSAHVIMICEFFPKSALWGKPCKSCDPGPHPHPGAMSQWPNFTNFIYGFCIRRRLPKNPPNAFYFIGVFSDCWNMNFGRIRQKTVVFIFWCLLHGILFSRFFFALRDISGNSLFRKLFILFTEILLKSRMCLNAPPPPKKKAKSELKLRV